MRVWLMVGLCVSLLLWGAAGPVLAQGGGGEGQATIHVVQRGETVFRIAQQYGTSVEAIAQSNGLSDVTSIQVGQRLLIPNGAVNASTPTAGQHTVQPGETLSHIALRYGTTPAMLAALNNVINPAQLFVGEVLDVSEVAPGHPAVTHGYTYSVQPDDTLYRIAARFRANPTAILNVNGLERAELIYPGQMLVIPGEEGAPSLQDLPAPLASFEVYPLPAEVGRTVALRVRASQPVTLSGSLLDRPVQFAAGSDGETLEALTGIHAFTVPGLYPLTVTAQDSEGHTVTVNATIQVVDGRYSSEVITLPAAQLALLDPDLNTDEYTLIAQKMTGFTPIRYFDGQMGLPAAAPVTSPFGTRRSYNGGPYDRFHTGADFGAPPGAPITAPASGVVVYVGMVSIHGNLTIIDHGWGVYTAYAHQSETYVQVGQQVNKGDVIGATGNTGRSIGPHLHWEMWVNGVEVDPLQWARVSFP
jgi:murein DD-endopeptidase MepM/ murein hydrolase activator NlpD